MISSVSFTLCETLPTSQSPVSVNGQQRSPFVDLVVDPASAQRMTIDRGVDGNDRLPEPGLGVRCEPCHRQVGVLSSDPAGRTARCQIPHIIARGSLRRSMIEYLPSTIESLRGTVLRLGLLSDTELDAALSKCGQHLALRIQVSRCTRWLRSGAASRGAVRRFMTLVSH